MRTSYVIKKLAKAGITFGRMSEQNIIDSCPIIVDTKYSVFTIKNDVGNVESIKSVSAGNEEEFTTCKALIAAIKAELAKVEEIEPIEPEKKEVEITESSMQSMVINLPGRPAAMLAPDLAIIYGVTTSALNQAVSRNKERFPEDFMFQATGNEKEILTSQSVMSNKVNNSNPYLFTREGANQLSSVLQSDTAVQRSIQIMRAFAVIEQEASAPALPKSLPEALRFAASIEEKRLALKAKIEADAPMVEYAEAVKDTTGAIKISVFAKELKNAGISTGPNKLFKWLRVHGYLKTSEDPQVHNNPYQIYINNGFFTLTQGWYWRMDKKTGRRDKMQCNTTKITGAGQIVIAKKLAESSKRIVGKRQMSLTEA